MASSDARARRLAELESQRKTFALSQLQPELLVPPREHLQHGTRPKHRERQRLNRSKSPALHGKLLMAKDGRHVFVEDRLDDHRAPSPNDFQETSDENTSDALSDSDAPTLAGGTTAKNATSGGVDAFEDSMAALAALISAGAKRSKTSPAGVGGVDCISCKARRNMELLDAWRPAASSASSTCATGKQQLAGRITRDSAPAKHTHHPQATTTDRTLLSLIEHERAKYLSLESTHTALIAGLANLQQAHRADVARLTAVHRHALGCARLEARERDGRIARTMRLLASLVDRYAGDMKEIDATADPVRAKSPEHKSGIAPSSTFLSDFAEHYGIDQEAAVESLATRIETMFSIFVDRCAVLQDAMQSARAQHRAANDRLAQRDADTHKLALFAKEKEDDAIAARDAAARLDSRAAHLERALAAARADAADLADRLAAKTADAADALALRERLRVVAASADELARREKMYLEEIEAVALRERRLAADLDAANAAVKAKTNELDALASARAKDLQTAKDAHAALKADLDAAGKLVAQQVDELSYADKSLKEQRVETLNLASRVSELSSQVNDLSKELKSRECELSQQREHELDMRLEIQTLSSSKEAAALEIKGLRELTDDLKHRLEQEGLSKASLQQQNTQRLAQVAEQIAQLQHSLSEAQTQLNQFEEVESSLRAQLRAKEEGIFGLQKDMSEMQQQINELTESLQKGESIIESIKLKKKEKLMAVQDRFGLAKAAMENEVSSLRLQLSNKSSLLSQQGDEIARIKIEVSELTADKFRLEARCAELIANESSNSRQSSNTAQLLRQKEQDLAVMGIKHEALVEQVRLLEDELHVYRESTFKRDIDQTKMQQSSDEIRRLREQSDLLEKRGVAMLKKTSSTSLNVSQKPLSAASSRSQLHQESLAAATAILGTSTLKTTSRSNSGLFPPANSSPSATQKVLEAEGESEIRLSIGGLEDY